MNHEIDELQKPGNWTGWIAKRTHTKGACFNPVLQNLSTIQ